jgi:hypothetical protein
LLASIYPLPFSNVQTRTQFRSGRQGEFEEMI